MSLMGCQIFMPAIPHEPLKVFPGAFDQKPIEYAVKQQAPIDSLSIQYYNMLKYIQILVV